MERISHFRILFFLTFILALTEINSVDKAEAIPAFARKYETSCTTCHTAFPKLNSFGRAYRNLGFQMPGGDAQYIKEKEVELGADAWKYAFPDGVWPGKIPGDPPIAIRLNGSYVLNTANPVEQDFKIPRGLNLLSAGTMGEDIAFFIGFHLFDDGDIGFLNRAYLQFSNVLTRWLPEYALNVRVGQFLPDVLPFAIHRGLMNTPYVTNAVGFGGALGGHHGSSGSLEQAQRGIEVKGILNHRIQYSVGLVNGNGIPAADHATGGSYDNNNSKDGYFRAAYKLGGMGLDGYDPEAAEGVLKDAENWKDNSVRLGVFGYFGDATPASSGDDHDEEDDHDGEDDNGDHGDKIPVAGKRTSTASIAQMSGMTTDFRRIGFDLDTYFGDLNLFGAFMMASETLDHGSEVEYNAWFIEGDYVHYPWLLPGLRYEMVSPEIGSSTTRIVPNITALIRGNIKMFAEMRIDPDEFDGDHIDLEIGLDFAF